MTFLGQNWHDFSWNRFGMTFLRCSLHNLSWNRFSMVFWNRFGMAYFRTYLTTIFRMNLTRLLMDSHGIGIDLGCFWHELGTILARIRNSFFIFWKSSALFIISYIITNIIIIEHQICII